MLHLIAKRKCSTSFGQATIVFPIGFVILAILFGCNSDSTKEPRQVERPADPGVTTPTSENARLKMDYSAKPDVEGFKRHTGSCDSYFRYNIQAPEEWEVEQVQNSFGKKRTDDRVFFVSVIGDIGELQARKMEEAASVQGMTTAGEITVGGQKVTVYQTDPEAYSLQIPHPAGPATMYHQVQVRSNLPTDQIIRILNTLEPMDGCD